MISRSKQKKKTGGVIVTAGKAARGIDPQPLQKIGAISAVKRIVLTFQQVGISPIIVVIGEESLEIEHELADYGVVFLRNEGSNGDEKFDYAKVGLTYLKDKCDQVIFNSVNVPMFSPETIQQMMDSGALLVSPIFRGRKGHPLLVGSALIPDILKYSGDMGLRGAIHSLGIEWKTIEIEDEGIFNELNDEERMKLLLEKHNQNILHPFLRLSIEKETLFFNSRTKLLLLLIQETHSVRKACQHIALSYSKAWNMLNELEKELGYAVVERQHGGNKGGKTYLTEAGAVFLEKYLQFEENVRQYTKEEFSRLFKQN